MLGELAARRDEYESAGIFFREAVRLDPDDEAASDWLAIVDATSRPAAAAHILPAPAAAAGRFPPRIAKGTRPPADPPAKRAAGTAPRANPFGPAKPLPGAPPATRPMTRVPELPGFGDYLVTSGILTREWLRAAQAYQRSMKVQLSMVFVLFGFVFLLC